MRHNETNGIAMVYVCWKIRCINRASRKMFDRHLVLNNERAVEAGVFETITHINAVGHREMTRYRQFFDEVDAAELERRSSSATKISSRAADPDYFEDENGNPLTKVDLFAICSGTKNPVLSGNVQSVLRLGPSGMRQNDDWDLAKSNDVAHYLQVMELLRRSDWIATEVSLTWASPDDAPKFSGPSLHNTTAALALIRQMLMHKDDVFHKAAKAYVAHVDSDEKQRWVHEELKRFDRYLDSTERFPKAHALPLDALSNSDLIDVVIYSTGLFHRKTNQAQEQTLKELRETTDPRRLLFAFQHACRFILEAPFTAAPLINMDFDHWVHNDWCPEPTRVLARQFFGEGG